MGWFGIWIGVLCIIIFLNFYKEIEILYLLARRENSNIRILATPLFFIKKKRFN